MSYKKPTLIEQYVTFSFKNEAFSQTKMFEVVPAIKNIGFDFVEIVNIEQPLILENGQVQKISIPRFRCWNKNRDSLVQLAPNQIFVNKVGKYLGWKDFSRLFIDTLGAIKELVDFTYIDAVAFNTVDVINIYNISTLDKYLNCGEVIPKWYSQIKEAFDITMGKGHLPVDRFNKQIQINGRVLNSSEYQIKILTLFQKIISSETNAELISNEVEKLHEESNQTFELMITDYTRENILGGIL